MNQSLHNLKREYQDSFIYQRLKNLWTLCLKIYHLPRLPLLRYRIITRVTWRKYRAACSKNVVIFPNYIQQSPHLFSGGYAISKIFLACSIKPNFFAKDIKPDLVIDWQDTTQSFVDTVRYVNESFAQNTSNKNYLIHEIVNCGCIDISKTKIAELSKKVLGQPLDVDPTRYNGLVVKKSDQNGKHDGEVIKAPIVAKDKDPTCVYSILIDNIYEGYATDYRLIYINGILDFFYEKKRPVNQRFSNRNEKVKLRSIHSEFTTHEISLIESFCRKIGADYGELDVLRDKNSGTFFIVDFAKTPAGPPNGLPSRDVITAIENMSVAFINQTLLQTHNQHIRPRK